MMEVLRIRVHRDELNVFNARANHVVYRVSAGTAHTNDFDARECFNFGSDFGHGIGNAVISEYENV